MPTQDAAGYWCGKLSHIMQRSRGDRYRMRSIASSASTPKPPSFAELAAIPDWLNWPEEQQKHLAIVAAILTHADAIMRELSGKKLRSLAMVIGNDLFDHIAEHYFDAALRLQADHGVAAELPRPEDLEAQGRQLLLRSLPLALQAQYPDALNDPYGQKIADLADAAIAALQSNAETLSAQEPEA